MANEKSVAEQVADLRAKWNPPPQSNRMDALLGERVPAGDGRATASVRQPAMDHPRNPGDDSIDAARLYTDDGSDDEDTGTDYSDMNKNELKAEIDRRNADRDEDDHLSKSGNKDDLIARLEEDDAAADEDDEDEEDDSEE